MYTAEKRGRAFRERLRSWFRRHGRDLPWRRTRDRYRVLVSEVMLQQTPVARVLPAYDRFLARFPTLAALRRAALAEVLVEWGGLGYPRRARDLHRAAHGAGRLPSDPERLDALPGIGRYTAHAVACFSSGAPVAFADTNIRRVLGRVILGRTATEREAIGIDASLLPRRWAAEWHHALMDLGATICLSRAPRCGVCPVYSHCLAKGSDLGPPRRRQAAYATSDRRVRGAIMRLLRRQRPVARKDLVREIGDERASRLLLDLAHEGLVSISGGRVSLPG